MKKRILLLLTTYLTTFNLASQGLSNEFQRTFVNDLSYIKLFDKSLKSIERSPFLFENFNNTGVLHTLSNKTYRINNINIDLVSGNYISKISKDSIFIYNGLDEVLINKRRFKKLNNKIYEILYKSKKYGFYKLYSKKKKKAIIHKMSGAIIKPERLVNKVKYVYIQNGMYKNIRLKKKDIQYLIKNKKNIKKYIKDNNLSYKKEKDVIQILKEYNKL